ncbi:MAG: PD-(D/E)XK nuclease family protein [Cyclobacteriaceae bacterium]
MEITEMKHLLGEFKKLPKIEHKPTYLEICKYPGSRFEQICSRLLAFYSDPKKPHGFGSLFINSLIECSGDEKLDSHSLQDVKVVTEDYADGNRIDLVIYNVSFAIGIENKIDAGLYNDLNSYKKRIDSYSDNNLKIILSLNRIDKKEKNAKKIIENGFINITYSDFLTNVKSKLGELAYHADQTYFTYLIDFMKTINKMTGENMPLEEHHNYFDNNFKLIENMLESFQQYKADLLNKQNEKLDRLKRRMEEESKRKWWIFGCHDFNIKVDKGKIGLEGWFLNKDKITFDEFAIFITYWDMDASSWQKYETQFLKSFPGKRFEVIHDNRSRKRMKFHHLSNYSEDDILTSLTECYKKIDEVVMTVQEEN